jgi:hypothetical protein
MNAPEPYAEGYQAAQADKPVTANSYPKNSDDARQWNRGHRQASRDRRYLESRGYAVSPRAWMASPNAVKKS